MAPSEIEPATFPLLAQCLNHLRGRVARYVRILFKDTVNTVDKG
jgi:hypothetical protein